ncbi:MAG: CPBP family intramembrane glutamic endopeptidase [Chloroflexota bacterium]
MAGSERLIVVIIGLAVVVILANLAETRKSLHGPLYAILLLINVVFLVTYATASNQIDVPKEASTLASVVALVFTGLATLLLFGQFRRLIAPIFPRHETNAETGVVTGFDPNSMTQMTGLIFSLYLLANTILEFILAGGLAGLAQNFSGVTTRSLWTQAGIFVLFAAIGVGLGVRRRLGATLQRLGLRAPTLTELLMGAAMAFFLYGLAFFIGGVWQAITPKDVFEQQTVLSEEIGGSVNTLMLGFVLAATAAIGEEIAFRGALQPVFGLWPTALLFALIHSQYVLTPASLLIFAVGLGFGWLRRRYNTTTAIVAHFLYDFVLVALAIIVRYAQAMGVAR